ncbi:MAG: SIS domain-containing protein [Verrucomicrobia bacterium]|nr:MAG: SIS domain-containing protein [Verrucomicrobiota bacterium]
MKTKKNVVVDFARQYLAGLQRVIERVNVAQVAGLIRDLQQAYDADQQIFIIGNGGSAGTASHMACDLAKTVLGKLPNKTKKRFRVMSMTDNTPLITALSNDLGFDHVFTEQLKLFARRGDLLVVISGSGNSPNLLRALELAREMELKTTGLLGFDGGRALKLLDSAVLIPDFSYGYVEDLHMVMDHLITAYFCKEFAVAKPNTKRRAKK